VLTAVADDDVLLLNTGVDGVGVAVLVILEVVDDVNTSVVSANPVVFDDVNASTLVLTAVDDDLSLDTHTHSHGSDADLEAL